MIKLIASDLDGTILQNGATNVSESLMGVINELIDMGIMFVPASGRQVYSLKQLFKPLADKLMYIAENGALVKYKDETIYKAPMDKNVALEIINDIYNRDKCEVLIAGEFTSYIRPKTQEFDNEIRNHFNYDVTPIDDFNEIKEDILKISVCDLCGINRSRQYFEGRWSGIVQTAVSGEKYLDFNDMTVNKGTAMKQIQKKFKFNADECMAFGDNYNDVIMFDSVAHSYVMETAVDEVKSHGRFRTDSVEKTLRHIFGL